MNDIQEPSSVPKPESTHSSLGVVIGVLIVVLVLIFCGIYLWGSMLTQDDLGTPVPARENREPETLRNDTDIEILQTVSSSDEIGAIEADLESTNLDGLNTELDIIDGELSQ